MKREVCIADVEIAGGFGLRLLQLGNYVRAEITNALGAVVFHRSLCESAEEALTSVRGYFASQRSEHTGVALCERARGEIRFSNGQEA